MSLNLDHYSVWTIIHKKTGEIASGYCGCPARLRGCCKYVIALLHDVVGQIEKGCNIACTSKPQIWHQPQKQATENSQFKFVVDLKVQKVKGSFDTHNTDNPKISRSVYDPRALIHKKDKKLNDFDLKTLCEISGGNCGV